jgi:hypothetical protein
MGQSHTVFSLCCNRFCMAPSQAASQRHLLLLSLSCRWRQEHQFKISLDVGLSPKATFGWDGAFKQEPASSGGEVELPLVTIRTKTHTPVRAEFGLSSAPCTVEITRQPRNTLLCNEALSLGELLGIVQMC